MFRKLGHPSLLVAPVFVYPTQLVHAQSVETGRHSRPPTTRNIDEGERVALTGNTHRDARTLRYWAPGLCAALLLLSWPMRGHSQTAVASIPAGTNPLAAAVNPVTNKIYVAIQGSSNNVTVIDGATNATKPVTDVSAIKPVAVAVNPVTNKIYVTNELSIGNNVTVIDGATNTPTLPPVPAGATPVGVAVNPATNKIYVANELSNNVTVIDGDAAPNTPPTTVRAGTNPFSVAVNPVTNKIYVANLSSNNVTVIDGATNTTTTVAVGTNPEGVAVNPVTNRIYVINNTNVINTT